LTQDSGAWKETDVRVGRGVWAAAICAARSWGSPQIAGGQANAEKQEGERVRLVTSAMVKQRSSIAKTQSHTPPSAARAAGARVGCSRRGSDARLPPSRALPLDAVTPQQCQQSQMRLTHAAPLSMPSHARQQATKRAQHCGAARAGAARIKTQVVKTPASQFAKQTRRRKRPTCARPDATRGLAQPRRRQAHTPLQSTPTLAAELRTHPAGIH
jgi:hypothetical protein